MMPSDNSQEQPPLIRYPSKNFWNILIPWIVVIALLGLIIWWLSSMELSCRFSGLFETPSAKAARSIQGIGVGEEDNNQVQPTLPPLGRAGTAPAGPAKEKH